MKKKLLIIILLSIGVCLFAKEESAPSYLSEFLKLNDKGYIFSKIKSQKEHKKRVKEDIQAYPFEDDTNLLDGLYLKTNTAYDLQNNDPAYDVRIELDLYDQGYYQYQKKKQKEYLDKKILFYRTLQSIEQLEVQSELSKVAKYENALDVSALLLELKFYDLAYQDAKKRVDLGLLRQRDLQGYKLNIQNIKDKLFYLREKELFKIPVNIWILLNNIENISLVEKDRLEKFLDEVSVHSKLIEAVKSKDRLHTDWQDKLRLNLYTGKRKMYLSQEQFLVGVEAKIPLTGYTKQKEKDRLEIISLDEESALRQKKAYDELQNSRALFIYEQKKIKTLSFKLREIKRTIHEVQQVDDSAYGLYLEPNVPKVEDLVSQYLKDFTLLQKERIAAYKQLLIIAAVLHVHSLEDIICK